MNGTSHVQSQSIVPVLLGAAQLALVALGVVLWWMITAMAMKLDSAKSVLDQMSGSDQAQVRQLNEIERKYEELEQRVRIIEEKH
jgi:hypothetical protein